MNKNYESHRPYLRLIMGHVLNKRLIWKLLRTIGNVLCGISWWGGHNGWACRWGGMHHGALMVLVLPLLGHIWYCRRNQCKKTASHGTKHMHMVHKALQELPSGLPLQCWFYHPTPTKATLGYLAIIRAIPQPQTPTPQFPALVILTRLSGVSLKATSLERPSMMSLQTWSHYEVFPSYYFSNTLFYNTKLCHLLEKGNRFIQRKTGIHQKAKIHPTLFLTPSFFISHHWILPQFPNLSTTLESHTIL